MISALILHYKCRWEMPRGMFFSGHAFEPQHKREWRCSMPTCPCSFWRTRSVWQSCLLIIFPLLSWGTCPSLRQLVFSSSVRCIFLLTCTSLFPTQLFYKNGQPFPAHRPVGLRVHICHVELAIDIPVTQEVLQEPNSNVVKVAFTVRRAGRYEITVKLGGLNVAYSPYYKVFQPGKV